MSFQSLVLEMDLAAAQAGHRADAELRDLLLRYSEACSQVNTRLMGCFSYLRQGFRSEAIRLSESDPPLLDCFGELRYFQSRDWWLAYARNARIPIPEVVDNFAGEVQESYDDHEPIRHLADELRLLNIHRRPVAERRRVLQILQELEPNSRVWRDGLTALQGL